MFGDFDQGWQMVTVVFQPVDYLSITRVMEDTTLRHGIPWQLVNKWDLVYLAHKVFQLVHRDPNFIKSQAKVIQAGFSSAD